MQQQIIVLTNDWSTVEGELFAFEGEGEAPLFSFPIAVGKGGMAWGRGEHAYRMLPGLHKKEGDNKTPAGLFTFGRAFGEKMPEGCRLPFLQTDEHLFCVDDPASRFYNTLVNTQEAVKDWRSAERMQRGDPLYELGIEIHHNTHPVTPGRGSCIFIHLWREKGSGTAGCTAMSREHLERLLAFLDPVKEPLLLQVPRSAYSMFLSSLRNEATRAMSMRRLKALMIP